jgi:capsular exopolysaccharide synthesis family protein
MAMQQKPTSGTRKRDVDYMAILRGMWRRHKMLATLVFAAIAAPGLLFVYMTSIPMYASRATISIEPAGLGQIPFVTEPSRRDTIATHMVLLRSRSLAEAVLEALPKDSQEELVAQPQHTDFWTKLRDAVASWLGKPLTVMSPREKALDELRLARMEFSSTREAAHIFSIEATATTPRVATDLVNTHIQVLLSRSRSVEHEEARRARNFLETQYQQTKESLTRAEEAVSKLQEQKGRFRTGGQADLELSRLMQLENALAETQANRQVLSARADSLRKTLGQTPPGDAAPAKATRGRQPTTAPVIPDENQARLNEFKSAQERLTKLETKLTNLRERYTDAHPLVQVTQEEITEQQAKMTQLARQLPGAAPAKSPGALDPADIQAQVSATEKELESLATREEALKLQVARLRGQIRTGSLEDREYGNLYRSVTVNRNLLAVLSDRLMAAKIREQGEANVIRVVDPASVPTRTTGRKAQKLALMILGLAGTIAFGLTFGLEFLRQPVETETDIVRATGLPILGSVGLMDHDLPGRQKPWPRKPIFLLSQAAGSTDVPQRQIHVELYRAIRANIETERLRTPFQSIVVTSPGPHEGKSTTILNLAHVFQEFGRRVLVVDADLRRPSLASPLELTSQPGVVDFLQGRATLEQVCRRLPSGVTVIPGQATRGDTAALLASIRFKELLQTAGAQFDLIFLDTAPVLAVPDNLLLANVIDRIILVAMATQTSVGDLRKAHATVARVGGQILGVVLNGASGRDVLYYRRRYRRYYTAPAGKDGKESPRRPRLSPEMQGKRLARPSADAHEESKRTL